MKGRARKRYYDIFLLCQYFILPAIGWKIDGLILAVIGLVAAYAVDFFSPKWKYELTWKDIDLALHNMHKYGRNPSELCFRVGDRRIYIYRDEKGNSQDGESVRMAVRIVLKDWLNLYNQEELSKLMHQFGYMGFYSKNRGPEAYVLFTNNGPDDCKEILKELFIKSVGGLRPDIMAQSVINTKKIIWLDHGKEENNKAA